MMKLKKHKGNQYGLGAVDQPTGDPTDIETVDPRLLDIEGQPRMDEETPSRPMTVAPDPTMQPQMQNPTSETLRPMTVQPMSDAQRQLNELNSWDGSIKKNQPLYNVQGEQIGTQTIKGKDRDTTHNWKDIARSMGLGALQGLGAGGLGGALGGAIAGTVRGAIDRNYDDKMQNEMFVRPRLEAQVQRERADAAYQNQVRLDNARATAMEIKPIQDQERIDIQRLKTEADAEYKTNQTALGTRKANELKIYRDAIIELKSKGADQNDKRIELLEKQFEEAKRRNAEAEKDKDLDRDARITTAQIMAGSRLAVARENNATRRDIALIQRDFQREKMQYEAAVKANDQQKAAEIRERILRLQNELEYGQ